MKKLILWTLILGMVFTSTGCIRFSTYEKERVDQQIAGNQGALVGKPLKTKENMGPTRTMIRWDIELPEPIDFSRLKDEKTPDKLQEGEGESNAGVLKGGVAVSTGAPEKTPVEPEKPKKRWFSKRAAEVKAKREMTSEGEIKTGRRPFRWYLPKPKTKNWDAKVEAAKKVEPKASFTLYASDMEEAAPEKPKAEKKSKPEYYKVKKNETLGDISMKVYGTSRKWKKIYNANKNKLKSPDKIYPGQKLLIPRD